MYQDNQRLLSMRSLLAGSLAVAAIILGGVYFTHGGSVVSSKPSFSYHPAITNPEVLKNWLPTSSYEYTVARINDYLEATNTAATSLVIRDNVAPNATTYNFGIVTQPVGTVLQLSVSVTNSNPYFSTNVTINGQPIAPTIPGTPSTSTPLSTNYSGFDALVDTWGVTATQSNELGEAIRKYAPSANTVSIDTSTIQNDELDPASEALNYTFVLTIDGKQYNATFTCIGLLRSRLVLVDHLNNRQAFDSGTIEQGT